MCPMQVFIEPSDKEYFILSGYDCDTLRRILRHRESLSTAGLLSICYMEYRPMYPPDISAGTAI